MSHKVVLGRTGIAVPRNGFGALPIQRVSEQTAVQLLLKAHHAGMLFYDTSRAYTDSEEKLGLAFHQNGYRNHIFLATKTKAKTPQMFWKDLEASLKALKTDYIDVYQFHNTPICHKAGDGSGLYEAMQEAKAEGKIRFIGFTSHKLHLAQEALDSGLYDTLQYPFSYLASKDEIELVQKCRKNNIGFIAMKALAGGLINNSAAAYAYIAQYEGVLPIWGVQRESELDEFISYLHRPPALTQALQDIIDRDRAQLTGAFCRGCGYCMPCPAGIEINECARMSLTIRRAPTAGWFSAAGINRMNKIADCTGCGQCKSRCPYQLDVPQLLQNNLQDYLQMAEKHHNSDV